MAFVKENACIFCMRADAGKKKIHPKMNFYVRTDALHSEKADKSKNPLAF
jgi:hypothetical protein